MKKIISFLICTFLFLICTTKASAEEIKYGNLVNDSTTIEEDFNLLGLSIDDYYKPSYNYEKFYVVAMSEAYIDEKNYDVQTYFYLYAPIRYYRDKEDFIDAAAVFRLTFESKNATVLSSNNDELLDYSPDHLLYKVKGFSYKYSSSNEIRISKIEHVSTRGLSISSDSNFKAIANHSKLNGFNVELAFNSTLIIDKLQVVDVKVDDDYFESYFKHFFQKGWGHTNELHLVFYNFNFPNSIKPDSIEYAKFRYNYIAKRENWILNPASFEVEYEQEILSNEEKIREYTPGTQSFLIDGQKTELEFETFVLGNRIEKGEFGNLKFSEEDKANFNYDCSILLDANIYINDKVLTTQVKTSYLFDDIELLELHYKKDGVLYKCQVVNKPVDKDDITQSNPEHPKSPWDKIKEFLIKIVNWILNNVFHVDSNAFPDQAKLAIGFVLCIVALILMPYTIKLLIFLIKLPFKIFKK